MKNYLALLWQQLKGAVASGKFWALVAALAGVGAALANGEITTWQALQAGVAALSVYAGASAIQSGLSSR